jgi:prepilin-type processing-associated H-X9-DG protein
MNCPSNPDSGSVEDVFDDVDPGEVAVIDTSGASIIAPANAEDLFYACEARSGQNNYIYFPHVVTIPGLTDQPMPWAEGLTNFGEFVAAMTANNIELALFFDGYTSQIDDVSGSGPISFDGDRDIEAGSYTAYRLREGIERFLITDINNPAGSSMAQSTIPVMLDEFDAVEADEFNHVPGGCNVLWMDGHVEFLRYPGEWPVSPAMAWIMASDDV